MRSISAEYVRRQQSLREQICSVARLYGVSAEEVVRVTRLSPLPATQLLLRWQRGRLLLGATWGDILKEVGDAG
jgi:hypothetical protein